MEEKKQRKCTICENLVILDQSGNGECLHCGWYNSIFDGQNKDKVMFPNLVSENKAKRLYKVGKNLTPSLEDFLEALYYYSEMKFTYKEYDCCLFLINEKNNYKIEFDYNNNKKGGKTLYFLNSEDFIKNAKIDDEYVNDIWNNVKDPSYM